MTMIRAILVAVLILAFFTAIAGAQEDTSRRSYYPNHRTFGLGLQVSAPYGDFNDSYNTGYGLQGLVDYPLFPLLSLTANLGWNRFPRDGEGDAIDVWEFSGGAKVNLGAFYIGGQVGYFTKVEETSWVPSLGLRWPRWEVAVRAKSVGGSGWNSLLVGYYF